jgi:regulator of sigma E protease
MHYVNYAAAFVFILGVLVVVHEWGHFIVARMCGIRVDEFSIGFGPRMARLGKLGDTEYNLRWVPLGGYVRIAGMEADEEPLIRAKDKVLSLTASKTDEDESESADTSSDTGAEPSAQRRPADDPGGFYAHPIWQRALVIAAGPVMSFVLGYVVIFGVLVTVGLPAGPAINRVSSVLPGSEAEHIGLRSGDEIVAVDAVSIVSGDQLVQIIHGDTNKTIHLTIHRGNATVKLTGVPHATKTDAGVVGTLGFIPVQATIRFPPMESFHQTNRFVVAWLQQIGELLRRHNLQQIRQTAGGPIFIAEKTKEAVDAGGESVWALMAQLSMSLALFNLLPIPILDGGHLLIFAIEAVRRGRRLTMEQQQNFMLAGLAVIGVLFVLIMFNDIATHVHIRQ